MQRARHTKPDCVTHPHAMPPKKETVREQWVDGVNCKVYKSNSTVVVGTGLVANAERDSFRLKDVFSMSAAQTEPHVRARKQFPALVALAAAAAGNSSAHVDEQAVAGKHWPPPLSQLQAHALPVRMPHR